jgi:hypothetical protein
MDEAVRQALAIDRSSPDRDRTIDITTTGAPQRRAAQDRVRGSSPERRPRTCTVDAWV